MYVLFELFQENVLNVIFFIKVDKPSLNKGRTLTKYLFRNEELQRKQVYTLVLLEEEQNITLLYFFKSPDGIKGTFLSPWKI